jgi:hypothetical protein
MAILIQAVVAGAVLVLVLAAHLLEVQAALA